jgi:hypothetical protein
MTPRSDWVAPESPNFPFPFRYRYRNTKKWAAFLAEVSDPCICGIGTVLCDWPEIGCASTAGSDVVRHSPCSPNDGTHGLNEVIGMEDGPRRRQFSVRCLVARLKDDSVLPRLCIFAEGNG